MNVTSKRDLRSACAKQSAVLRHGYPAAEQGCSHFVFEIGASAFNVPALFGCNQCVARARATYLM